VLGAIAVGKNRHSEIVESVHSERQVARVLDDLEKLRLVERVTPVTEVAGRRGGRTVYRIADNFLAFWLGPLSAFLGEIDRGMGAMVAQTLHRRLDHHVGPRYEDAFRSHLRRLAAAGELGEEVLRVGPFWTTGRDQVEIDAVVLAGTPPAAVAVGECKWAERVNAATLLPTLAERARYLPTRASELRYVVCARKEVTGADGVLPVRPPTCSPDRLAGTWHGTQAGPADNHREVSRDRPNGWPAGRGSLSLRYLYEGRRVGRYGWRVPGVEIRIRPPC
jgi:hypothetical protein